MSVMIQMWLCLHVSVSLGLSRNFVLDSEWNLSSLPKKQVRNDAIASVLPEVGAAVAPSFFRYDPLETSIEVMIHGG
ncbi:MAG: hypothetical protein AAFV77_02240 [Planctomycetota bacterium]